MKIFVICRNHKFHNNCTWCIYSLDSLFPTGCYLFVCFFLFTLCVFFFQFVFCCSTVARLATHAGLVNVLEAMEKRLLSHEQIVLSLEAALNRVIIEYWREYRSTRRRRWLVQSYVQTIAQSVQTTTLVVF